MLSKIDWSGVIEKVIGGLIVAAILAIVGWAKSLRFRLFLKRLWNTVIEWLMQFHRINLNMLLWPWTDSPQVVGDRVKNMPRQAICAASGGD